VNKMIRWTVFFIGIITFFVFGLLLATIKQRNNFRILLGESKQMSNLLKYEKKIDSIRFTKQLFTDELVMRNLALENLKDQIINLNDIIKDFRLIYHFTPESCNTCVENDIAILNQLCNTIGYERVILISNYDNIRKLKIFINENKIKFNCYNYSKKLNLPIEEDENDAPFFFIIDSCLKIHLAHHTNPEYKIQSFYFQRIKLFFKQSDNKI